MAKKLERLSSGQEAQISVVRDEWIARALSQTGPIPDVAEKVAWLYSLADLPTPIVLEVESPLAAQVAVNVAAAVLQSVSGESVRSRVRSQVMDQVWSQVEEQVWNQVWNQIADQVADQVESQVESQVRSQIGDQVWSQVKNQVWNQVESQVESQVRSQVMDQVGNRVWNQVADQVWSQVGSQIADQVGSQIADQVWSQVRGQVEEQIGVQVWSQVEEQVVDQTNKSHEWSRVGIGWNAGWTSWIDYFVRHTSLEISDELRDRWNRWIDFVGHAWDGVFLRGLAVVCRRPSAVRRDDRGRLHSIDKPAIEWADGLRLYYVAGIPMQSADIEHPETITVSRILEERNAEVRKGLMQILGVSKFLQMTQAEVIDEDFDVSGMPRRLFRFQAGYNQEWCVVEVECPSKRDKHYLFVPPTMERCSQAIAWTFGFEIPEDYNPMVEA